MSKRVFAVRQASAEMAAKSFAADNDVVATVHPVLARLVTAPLSLRARVSPPRRPIACAALAEL